MSTYLGAWACYVIMFDNPKVNLSTQIESAILLFAGKHLLFASFLREFVKTESRSFNLEVPLRLVWNTIKFCWKKPARFAWS